MRTLDLCDTQHESEIRRGRAAAHFAQGDIDPPGGARADRAALRWSYPARIG